MNLEQAIEDEVEKWNTNPALLEMTKLEQATFLASLHSIALATANALRVEEQRINIDTYLPLIQNWDGANFDTPFNHGHKLAISDSQKREQKWFGKDLTSK